MPRSVLPIKSSMRIPGDEGRGSAALIIEKSTPRVVFAQLVARALDESSMRPSAMAIAYLVELLSERVRRIPAASLAAMLTSFPAYLLNSTLSPFLTSRG